MANLELRTTFDSAAALYHAARPGYPEELFDDLASIAALESAARVLEVGAGTGIATLPLARRGYRITALEPGAALASELRRNAAAFTNVEVIQDTLEGWEPPAAAYDLASAATSWHWVEQPRGYEQLARTLTSTGGFALFGHTHVKSDADRDFFTEVRPIYLEHAPEIWVEGDLTEADRIEDDSASLLASGVFRSVEVRRYRWDETYSAERYGRILRTFSNHIALPSDRRERLIEGIENVIDGHFGGEITKGYLVILHVARR